MLLLRRAQLAEILGVDIVPRRLREAFQNAGDPAYNNQRPLLTFARELILPPYKKRYVEEGRTEQVLRGTFYDNAIPGERGAIFYGISNHYSGFTSSLHIGTVTEIEDENGPRLIYPAAITVYASPVLPGAVYNVQIAPGAMQLVTPFTRAAQLKALEILGGAVRSIEAGAPLKMEALREKLIEKAGLEPYPWTSAAGKPAFS